jgi:CubicO group peptidase (beta-lactamase class C family)
MGLMDLDGDVSDWLVSWKLPENEFTTDESVTLRRLLSHTAGVSISGFKGYLQSEQIPTLTQILDGLPPASNRPIRVERIPGTQWSYSGGGYQIVEQLLIDIAAMPFPEIIQESILEPAEMASTICAAELPEDLKADTASAHGHWGQPIVGKWLNTPYMGAGGCLTTPTDLGRFASQFMLATADQSNLDLSRESAQLMIAPHAEGIPFIGPLSMDWGLGWQLNRIGGRQYISHGGDFPEGYQHLLVAAPESGWGVVIMTNGANGDVLQMEILYALAVSYGLIPSLRGLVLGGYLLFQALSLGIVWLVTFLISWAAVRKKGELLGRGKSARVHRATVAVTIIAVSIIFYAGLSVGLGFLSGPPQVSAVHAMALAKVEEGELLANHGMIEEAIASFTHAQQIYPAQQIPASAWNQLCIRGSVWGYVADVMYACDLAVSLAPKDSGLLFGRGLARALTNNNAGAIDDFEEYVAWTKERGFYDPYGIEVEEFIVELEAGKNPFDEELLDEWK